MRFPSLAFSSSSSSITSSLSSYQNQTLALIKAKSKSSLYTTMSIINLQAHAFAGNPLISRTPKSDDPSSPNSALETLKTLLLENTHDGGSSQNFKVLPFRKGRALACSSSTSEGSLPVWHLGWISLADCRGVLEKSETRLTEDSFVYIGSNVEDDVVYWAIDVLADEVSVIELGEKRLCFVELRTLMVATDWADAREMGELAIAGHARALLEWHNVSRFCGYCGEKTIPKDAGRRKQCSNELCKKRIYPCVDPVVIMLVIDRENDRALLSRQSRFVPRMWSCLAGFIEPGESLEEAVRRETWEETGIEVGEVIYHSSQPWPAPINNLQELLPKLVREKSIDRSTLENGVAARIGPSSMPCQLMVGFFAYAKSLEINVDKKELEDAQWHSREDVKKAMTFAEYEKAQRTAAAKVEQMCKGVEKGQNFASDFNLESGELASMFIPGPFAIAHHLISSWVNQASLNPSQCS